MKRKQLLMTLLLALVVPLAANAYVERTVTVYNGIAKNSHIPIEGWNNGSNQPFSVSFSVSEFDLARAGLYDKPISKMAFHVATPGVYTITNNNRYTIKMRNPALENEFTTVAEDVLLRIDEYGVMEINFNWHYTYRGGADLIINISSPMSYQTSYPDHLPQFYGVNIPGVENGYGTHGNGFKPKITFTYFDEATWANTNRPQGLWLTVGSDGTSLGLSWDAVEATDATYKVCCMPRGTTPSLDYNSSNWVTSQNTLSHTFTGLTPNTEYDLYVCARNQTSASAYSRAMCTTKRIANLDEEGDLELDFDEGFVSNGITCTGDNSYMLDVIRTRYYPWIYVNQYNSYYMNYEGTATATVNLPQITFSGASNGVIMEFDLWSANNLQVKFIKQGVETSLGTFSAGDNKIHYTVRATESLANQNHNAYFQLVSSGAFSIDNIVIYKPAATMKPYNIQASDITTNSATITWDDDNTGNVTYYMRYRKSGTENWSTNQSAITQNEYELTGLDTYCQYEVQMMAYRNSTDYSDYTESFVFATACPATQTTYTQSFTNLSDLPSYWRVATGEGVSYSVSDNKLKVFNSEYLGLWGYTYYTLDAYIILPYFKNLATLQLDFEAGFNWGSSFELTVGVMSDPFDASTFSILKILTLNNSSTTYNISLADAACQHGHIAIKLSGQNSFPPYEEVWFNNFTVTRAPEPTDLMVSNVTNTSATFSWTTSAPSVELQYREAGGTWTTVTPDANPYTLTGLTNSTEYEVQVRANYGSQDSEWASFDNIRTLMQEAVLVDVENPFSESFENNDGNWLFINGMCTNRWSIGDVPGPPFTDIHGNLLFRNGSAFISDDNGTSWHYTTRTSGMIGNLQTPSTVYLAKTFTLLEGMTYTFSYRYEVNGSEDSDYLRVFLVPAYTVLEANANGGTPCSNFSTEEPSGWIALDGGEQLASNNSDTGCTGNASFGNNSMKSFNFNVYEGGDFPAGDYMMVFVWHNGSGRYSYQRPAAVDNVSISCTSLIDPPTNIAVDDESDTEVTLSWTAPSCTLTPTGYQVQYEPLGNNDFNGAPIVDVNTNAATLTGLTPHTNYRVRVRSMYAAGGNAMYSAWTEPVAITTLYPRPTNLALVEQTTSWASMMWDAVAVELEEGQYLGYSYQLTTVPDNWGATHDGVGGNVWSLTLAPGTYYFRVQTVVRGSNNTAFRSPWSEPITFTIAPWTDAVTVFPLTYGFEGSHFDDGITLGGNVDDMGISLYYNSEVSPHDGSENENMLRFNSGANRQAYLVLPPLHPSTGNALVSFWWYHHSGHQNFQNTNINDGVEVETSTDGQSWSTASYGMIPRYDADYSGWKKYDFVFPASANPTYVRLHFRGTPGSWLYCYLDDLTVNAFESQQPYISYVGCDSNSATITLYDYAVENGYHSSQFEVQYREWRDPSETPETWADYDVFVNQEPYTFENTLTVNGLQPATCYEFRARARVSYGGYNFDWSGYCEPVRQWTDCGTYTITPSYSYTEDFEDLFNGTDCWTAGEGWEMQHEGGYSGDYCAYLPANTNSKMTMPLISSSGCDNVIIRFWSKGPGYVYAYYGQNFASKRLIGSLSNTTDWVQNELSISYSIKNNAPLKISFEPIVGLHKAWYVDDIEIVANAYDKIFDPMGISYTGAYEASTLWFPNGVPTAEDNVMIMGSAKVGFNGTTTVNAAVGEVAFSKNGSLTVNTTATLTANEVDATRPVTVYGTANITTLNAGAANSVVVKDGGVLYAATITGTSTADNNKVVVEDGGQLKTDNAAYATIKKNIGSYTAIEAENHVTRGGYYLISSPLNMNNFNPYSAGALTSVVENGQEVLTYDLYKFDYEQELEWRNYKDDDFPMRNGYGYLYANRDGVDLSFAGPVAANNTQMPVSTNYGQGSHYDFNGWTLVGNPMTCNAYVSGSTSDMSFFRMNPVGNGFIAATGTVAPMEGIFVYTQMAAQAVFFNRDEPTEPGSKLGINLMQGNTLVDNAIIRFGQGGTLPKFSFSNNTSKIYIPMADDDYAVVSSQPVGVLPLNFEAAKDGTYTLSFEDTTEGLLYCHLIDNKTGADVDLLATPDYSFNAKADDYAYRFKVVFVASSEDAEGDSETFAFNNNGNWIIANEGRATLQVIDLNGRILSSEQIEGSAETRIDAVPGLYLIRLINGENVKVQKVVVR